MSSKERSLTPKDLKPFVFKRVFVRRGKDWDVGIVVQYEDQDNMVVRIMEGGGLFDIYEKEGELRGVNEVMEIQSPAGDRLSAERRTNSPGPRGDEYVCLKYPGINGNGEHIYVDLEHVRANDGLRLSYDFERDGWKVEQPKTLRFGEDGDMGWTETGFFQAWALNEDPDDE